MPLQLPPEEDKPGVPLAPPFLFVIPLAALLIVEWFVPTHFVSAPWDWALGGLALALGLALNLWGAVTQRRAGTDFLPERPSTVIVSSGPYAFTRNPMYVGFALFTLGLALLFDSLWALLAVPLGIVLIQQVIITREERYLERKFGAEYVAYKTRVRRWL